MSQNPNYSSSWARTSLWSPKWTYKRSLSCLCKNLCQHVIWVSHRYTSVLSMKVLDNSWVYMDNLHLSVILFPFPWNHTLSLVQLKCKHYMVLSPKGEWKREQCSFGPSGFEPNIWGKNESCKSIEGCSKSTPSFDATEKSYYQPFCVGEEPHGR